MAPTKNSACARGTLSKPVGGIAVPVMPLQPIARKGLVRRATAPNLLDQNNMDNIQTRAKRKADHSPLKNQKVKRSALGNLTNNVKMMTVSNTANIVHQSSDEDVKIQMAKKIMAMQAPGAVQMAELSLLKDVKNVCSGPITRHQQQQKLQNKITTRANARNGNATAIGSAQVPDEQELLKENVEPEVPATVVQPTKKEIPIPAAPPPPVAASNIHIAGMKAPHKPMRRISNEFNKTEESLYMSALEDLSSTESVRFSGNFEAAKRRSALLQVDKIKTENTNRPEMEPPVSNEAGILNESATDDTKMGLTSIERRQVPDGIEDFDKVNWNDPFQVSHYAMDIFEYLKTREQLFQIGDYMANQVHLSKWMRSLLVDWMVEVQETFELNHETLYMAVKVVDLYLSRVVIHKNRLQLLGAAALFIACKYDERTPPLIEDFLYICDGAYKHKELIQMEMEVLRIIDFDLGMPLSYRFLRRYARCARVQMNTLTLARYILEMSLMDYTMVPLSESKVACAALFMALRLHNEEIAWTATLEHYSGYSLAEFAEIVPLLNANLPRKPKSTIKTIRSKYSHKIFHEVAKVKLLSTEKLFERNLDLSETTTQLTVIEVGVSK